MQINDPSLKFKESWGRKLFHGIKEKWKSKFPREIPFSLDEELNNFLEERKVRDGIENVRKSYKNRRLIPYCLLWGYFIVIWVASYCIQYLIKNKNCGFIITVIVMLVFWFAMNHFYKRTKTKLNVTLATNVRNLSRIICEVLKNTVLVKYNKEATKEYKRYSPEYLEYILTQQIQRRRNLDNQFDQMSKTIIKYLNIALIGGMIISILVYKLIKELASANLSVCYLDGLIAAILFVGSAIDWWNYNLSDAYHFRCQSILDAVTKYRIESKEDEK